MKTKTFKKVAKNLFLRGNKNSASWIVRLSIEKKQKDFGIGSYPATSEQRALEIRDQYISWLRIGKNPTVERLKQKTMQDEITFGEMFEWVFTNVKAKTMRNEKNKRQYYSRVYKHVLPQNVAVGDGYIAFKKLPVSMISAQQIVAAIRTFYLKHPSTGKKLIGDIVDILSHADAQGFRAESQGAIDVGAAVRKSLPALDTKKRHYAKLHHDDAPNFLRALQRTSFNENYITHDRQFVQTAYELMILTAARPAEICAMRWSQIDLEKRLRTIPAAQMKNGQIHHVPLSKRALTLLRRARKWQKNDYVFPAIRGKKHIGSAVLNFFRRRLGQWESIDGNPITEHGWRGTFRNWASIHGVRREVAELCLSHSAFRGETEAAYSDELLLDERRDALERWAEFLHQKPAKITLRVA